MKRKTSVAGPIRKPIGAESLDRQSGCRHPTRAYDKRILVISHMYPSKSLPGSGCFIHEQIAALRKTADVDARVVCCVPMWMNKFNPLVMARIYRIYRATLRRCKWERCKGTPVLYLPYLVGGFCRPWLHHSTYAHSILRVSNWIKATFDFELIHAHTAYLDGTAALKLSRKFDVPYVITEHTGPFRLLTDHWVKRRATVRSLTHARRVYCVSGALAGDVRNVLPAELADKVQVLHNGVDTRLFAAPRNWAFAAEKPRVLSVMSLDDNKNPVMLLEAFRTLRRDVPGASLTIAGDGPLHGALLRKIEAEQLAPHVSLVGFKKRPEIAALMRDHCDVFVLSSNSETFGVVLIEAMASGKPIVATDCGGPRDVVTDPTLGMLCPTGDAASMAQAMLSVVHNLSSYDPEQIRQHAIEHYDYRQLAARLHVEYDAIEGAAGKAA